MTLDADWPSHGKPMRSSNSLLHHDTRWNCACASANQPRSKRELPRTLGKSWYELEARCATEKPPPLGYKEKAASCSACSAR